GATTDADLGDDDRRARPAGAWRLLREAARLDGG
ncbi:MAG: hypothetical protein AVDCRST_MAG87-2891, partial [uncultured Thermomicrobiales bacterium]